MLVEFEDLLSLSDIAKLIGVSRQRVTQLYQKNKLPAPVGKKHGYLWLRSDIEKWNASRFERQLLSPKQLDILLQYSQGLKHKNIAENLGINNVAVKLQRIKNKLNVKSTREIIVRALNLGLISAKIKTNKIRCKFCGEVIESTHVHDFKTCKCKRVSVDGGHDYLRRCFQEQDDFEELSEAEYTKGITNVKRISATD